ncbi:MAG: TldD/PmbA family protein, partial [Rhodospirillales bacterium]|nr:TldD/PmbA family protein [Rhodospirillales bacterium]
MAIADDPLNRLDDLIRKAKAAGADAADAVFVEGRSLAVSCRLGQREQVEGAEESDIGLRVFIGKRQAIVSSSDLSAGAMDELAEKAVAMARVVPEDPYCGLPSAAQLATTIPDIDCCDDTEPTAETLLKRALAAEEAALAVPGITNSEGGEAAWSIARSAIVASNGFAQTRGRSSHSISVSVLAGQGTEMERDYDFTSAVYGDNLSDPATIGRSAGERAVKRLHPRKAQSAQVSVVYEPRMARSLIGHLAAAINGSAVARGTTFLLNKMDKPILPDSLTVIDDPLRRRGLRSR